MQLSNFMNNPIPQGVLTQTNTAPYDGPNLQELIQINLEHEDIKYFKNFERTGGIILSMKDLSKVKQGSPVYPKLFPKSMDGMSSISMDFPPAKINVMLQNNERGYDSSYMYVDIKSTSILDEVSGEDMVLVNAENVKRFFYELLFYYQELERALFSMTQDSFNIFMYLTQTQEQNQQNLQIMFQKHIDSSPSTFREKFFSKFKIAIKNESTSRYDNIPSMIAVDYFTKPEIISSINFDDIQIKFSVSVKYKKEFGVVNPEAIVQMKQLKEGLIEKVTAPIYMNYNKWTLDLKPKVVYAEVNSNLTLCQSTALGLSPDANKVNIFRMDDRTYQVTTNIGDLTMYANIQDIQLIPVQNVDVNNIPVGLDVTGVKMVGMNQSQQSQQSLLNQPTQQSQPQFQNQPQLQNQFIPQQSQPQFQNQPQQSQPQFQNQPQQSQPQFQNQPQLQNQFIPQQSQPQLQDQPQQSQPQLQNQPQLQDQPQQSQPQLQDQPQLTNSTDSPQLDQDSSNV